MIRRSRWWRGWGLPALLAVMSSLVGQLPARAQEDASARHLLAGAAHFRAGRFAEALVEFEVAKRAGAGADADWYLAASLLKLGRPEDALEAFTRARREAPASADALLDYYEAMACYDAHLLACAQRLLSRVETAGGPRVAEEAKRIRATVEAALGNEPPIASIDLLTQKGIDTLSSHRPLLAARFFEEAQALAARRPDRHRSEELERRVAQAQQASGEPGR